MIITTTETISGKEIVEILGIVKGNTVRARNFGNDILAGLKNLIGGEVKLYSELMFQSREQATQRMIDEAKSIGADAIVNVRYSTSTIVNGTSEILVYGTAVKLK